MPDRDFHNSVESGKEGERYEITLRALSYLLTRWCAFDGSRKVCAGEPERELRAIPFDKLALLFARLWNEVHLASSMRLPPGSATHAAYLNPVVTFPCPFQERPGKHGPGLAIDEPVGPPKFLITIIKELQDENVISYFEILTDPHGAGLVNDYRTVVSGAIPVTNIEDLLEDGFTPTEQRVLRDLGSAFRHLGAGELRALGTHENVEKTVRDINLEFKWAAQVKRRLLQSLAQGQMLSEDARTLCEYAAEACRKSHENRVDYLSGHIAVSAELTVSELQTALTSRQMAAHLIWDDPQIKALAHQANNLRALAEIVFQVSCVAENKPIPLPRKQEFAKATLKLAPILSHGLPPRPEDFFTSSSRDIISGGRTLLSNLLSSENL